MIASSPRASGVTVGFDNFFLQVEFAQRLLVTVVCSVAVARGASADASGRRGFVRTKGIRRLSLDLDLGASFFYAEKRRRAEAEYPVFPGAQAAQVKHLLKYTIRPKRAAIPTSCGLFRSFGVFEFNLKFPY